MSAGTSQNAYADAGMKLNSVLGQGQAVNRKILKKAYEIFIHALGKGIIIFQLSNLRFSCF